jgi:hypothetical protein
MRLWLRNNSNNYYDDDGYHPILCAESLRRFLKRRYPQYNWSTMPRVIEIYVYEHSHGKFQLKDTHRPIVYLHRAAWEIFGRCHSYLRRKIGYGNRFNVSMKIIRW